MTGHRTGVDYAAIRPTADLYEIKPTPALMSDIRMMEAAALAAFAEAETRRARR